MTWHAKNKSIDGKVHHVPNNKAWQHIDNTWLDFATEPRNVKLGLAIDGVNPFEDKNNVWSTWLVLFLIYNLPPWLVTKKFFMLLSIIILGPDNVKSANFDVLITSLIEELQELWEGVRGCHGRASSDDSAVVVIVRNFPQLGSGANFPTLEFPIVS
jgi:hypothetical protein